MLLLQVPSGTEILAPSCLSLPKVLYNPKAFFTHAASLDQGCPHCPRFPTAASRRSLGRVSVPVWPIILSDRLPIAALVGRYPTNQLIGRGPIPGRELSPHRCGRIRCQRPFPAVVPNPGAGSHALLTRAPLASRRSGKLVRLACVRHAASVRSEPGSNSQVEDKYNRLICISSPDLLNGTRHPRQSQNPSLNHVILA